MGADDVLCSESEEQTEALGQALGEVLQAGAVVGLVGELGAGKTCLARGVARGLGVDPACRVSSPTFTLVNEYPGRLPLYHIDLYRLADPEELWEVGLDHYYRGDGACLVEWFDRFPDQAPPAYLLVALRVTGDHSRELRLSPVGPAHQGLCRRWVYKCAGSDHLG